MTGERAALLALRVALAACFISAVADRLGCWGAPGAPGVAWGAWAPFVAFTGTLNPRAPAVAVPVIASGGVGTLDHLVEGVTEGGASAVLAASIFHFGEFTIAEAKAHMAQAGIPVRLS